MKTIRWKWAAFIRISVAWEHTLYVPRNQPSKIYYICMIPISTYSEWVQFVIFRLCVLMNKYMFVAFLSAPLKNASAAFEANLKRERKNKGTKKKKIIQFWLHRHKRKMSHYSSSFHFYFTSFYLLYIFCVRTPLSLNLDKRTKFMNHENSEWVTYVTETNFNQIPKTEWLKVSTESK